MKQLFVFLTLLAAQAMSAQTAGDAASPRPFEGHYYCSETGVHLYLNLYEPSLSVPGSDFLGPMNGYMQGGIYGTWMLTRHKVKGSTARLRFSNDIGSDSQDIDFRQVSDSVFTYQAVGGNAIRKAVGTKLVKVTGSMVFRRVGGRNL
ncbi:MAG: hypothetical protein ACI3YD_01745 [Alloprevotella sp.]